jgi:pyridoxamine 5'-phosphate oxidase
VVKRSPTAPVDHRPKGARHGLPGMHPVRNGKPDLLSGHDGWGATRVRAIMLMFANENGFYFETLSPKEMSKQMKRNAKVEICFYNNPAELQHAKTMRVTGEVEFVEDAEIKRQAFEKVKFLEDIAGRPLEHLFEVFRIKSGEAHFWTMKDVLKEPQIERVRF